MLMDAHMLTVALAALIPVGHVVLIRVLKKPERSVRLMFLVFAVYVFSMTVIYERLDLGLLMVGPMALSVTICLVYMELFSMLCRGFSLAIVSVLYDNGPMKMRKSVLFMACGMAWMIEKRIDSIEKMGLVRRESAFLRAFFGGVLVGRSARFYKELIKIGAGGYVMAAILYTLLAIGQFVLFFEVYGDLAANQYTRSET